jgi:hypothetical protein
MTFTRNTLAPTLAALALTLSCGSALANIPTRDLLPAASPVARTDVRVACAGIDQHLQQSLSRLRQHHALQEDLTVRFVLEGQEVRDVQVSGAVPMDTRNAVRRAMRQLSCSDSAALGTPQSFSFVLGVSEPFAPTLGAAPRG